MFALAAATQAPAVGQQHQNCMETTAARLEASGESASDVAAATVQACASSSALAQPGGVLATLPAEQQIALMRQQGEMEMDQVRLFVVELRACRRTKGCAPAAKP